MKFQVDSRWIYSDPVGYRKDLPTVHSRIHPRALLNAQYQTSCSHGLSSSRRQSDWMNQPRAGTVPVDICQPMSGQLDQPPPPHWIPIQQPCPLFNSTPSLPLGNRLTPAYGFQARPTSIPYRVHQQVHRPDHPRGSKGHLIQVKRWHDEVLQPKTVCSSQILAWIQSLPWCQWHLDHPAVQKAVTQTSRTVPDRDTSWK